MGTILFVDDEEKILSSIKRVFFDEKDIVILTSSSPKEALSILERSKIDVIVSDQKMPEMTGIEFLNIVKEKYPGILRIILTGFTEASTIIDAINNGEVYRYITKPWDNNELKITLKKSLEFTYLKEKNNQLYNELMEDMKVASKAIKYFLPEWASIVADKYFFSYTYKPSVKVGGDLLDIVKISENKHVVYLGDISGHGVQAAIIMTAVKSIINIMIKVFNDETVLHQFFNKLNLLLSESLLVKNYMCFLFGVIDIENNTFTYINAGHPPIIEYDPDKRKAEILDLTGSVPLGGQTGYKYSQDDEKTISIDDDKIRLLYTDGAFECRNITDEQLELNGFREFISQNLKEIDKKVFPHKIQSELSKSYDISHDDFTILSFFKIHNLENRSVFKTVLDDSNYKVAAKQCRYFVSKKINDDELAENVEKKVIDFFKEVVKSQSFQKTDSSIIVDISFDQNKVVTIIIYYKSSKSGDINISKQTLVIK